MTAFLLALPILLFSVVAHEYAHAWTAYRQGDDTAYALGRLTLNPIPHIDPMMSVIFPVALYWMTHGAFTFGAAKPVPVDPRKFRDYKRGDVIVSSAGIVTNLLLVVASAALFAAVGFLGDRIPTLAAPAVTLQQMFVFGVVLNLTLAIFNLVPIPPLDGSHLLYHALPPAWAQRYRRLGRYGFVVILALFLVPGVWNVVFWPVGVISERILSLLGGFALGSLPQ